MVAALEEISREGKAAVVRGAHGPLYPADGGDVLRLAQPQDGLIYAKTGKRVPTKKITDEGLVADGERVLAVTWLPMLVEQARWHVIFDVDQIPVDPELAEDWVDHPEEAVARVVERFPAEFQDTSCWWALSSSAAAPSLTGREVSPTYKLRLAFWLDRPLTSAQA